MTALSAVHPSFSGILIGLGIVCFEFTLLGFKPHAKPRLGSPAPASRLLDCAWSVRLPTRGSHPSRAHGTRHTHLPSGLLLHIHVGVFPGIPVPALHPCFACVSTLAKFSFADIFIFSAHLLLLDRLSNPAYRQNAPCICSKASWRPRWLSPGQVGPVCTCKYPWHCYWRNIFQ